MTALEQQIQRAVASPLVLGSLTRSDCEAALETWLTQQGVSDAWELAPALVNVGLETTQLEEVAAAFRPPQFLALMRWLISSYGSHNLLSEVSLQANRISSIVNSLKSYVYLDQAPLQDVDIHMGLDDTLTVLANKLRHITVRRDYAPYLPKIPAYGSDLNQVWTNLLNNAIDALKGQGQIILRTKREEDIIVEIEDNGPGISAEYLPRIFDPFFTTKPPGKGVGLGLSISYNIIKRHNGTIGASSQGGQTIFQIHLPLSFVLAGAE